MVCLLPFAPVHLCIDMHAWALLLLSLSTDEGLKCRRHQEVHLCIVSWMVWFQVIDSLQGCFGRWWKQHFYTVKIQISGWKWNQYTWQIWGDFPVFPMHCLGWLTKMPPVHPAFSVASYIPTWVPHMAPGNPQAFACDWTWIQAPTSEGWRKKCTDTQGEYPP